jgi:hypothetical protein
MNISGVVEQCKNKTLSPFCQGLGASVKLMGS